MSQDVDVAIPVGRIETAKARLKLVRDLVPSAEEPSVYVPTSPELIEANFLGLDERISDAGDTYVLDDESRDGMSSRARDVLDRRAREVRVRGLVRRWRYRQRDHADGVWFRLRRVLADAERIFVIDDADLRALVDEGYAAEPCGAELEPPKAMIFVDARRLASLTSRRPVPVTLGHDLLSHTAIVLVPFDSDNGPRSAGLAPSAGSQAFSPTT